MLFRLWFLYAFKLGLLGLILLVANFAPFPDPVNTWIFYACLGIFVPLGIAGVILGITLALQNFEMSCPICNRRGGLRPRGALRRKITPYEARHMGVDCENCGYVYTKNAWLSFKLLVDEHGHKEDE